MWSPTRWLGRRREPLRVACASGEGYLPHCATMMHSIIVSQRRPVELHLLASQDVTPESERRLSHWVERLGAEIVVHRIHDSEERFRGLIPNMSLNNWFRVLLPDLLPDCDRVLYLDCDVIVLDSLDPPSASTSGKCIAAIADPPITLEWMQKHCASLSLPDTDDYFNAGVMLMDLEELRAKKWIDQVIDYGITADHQRRAEVDEGSPREIYIYAMRYPERLLFTDQDALNAVLYEHRLKLHPRWNVQTLFRRSDVRTAELTERRVAEAFDRPAIRHSRAPDTASLGTRRPSFPTTLSSTWRTAKRRPGR